MFVALLKSAWSWLGGMQSPWKLKEPSRRITGSM